jgi:hypothetical protein
VLRHLVFAVIRWDRIFAECDTFANLPIFVAADSEAIGSWPVLANEVSTWMEQAREIALAGHGPVHEDGRNGCSSESDSEHSDHGEDIPYESAYTLELLGPDGKPKFGGPQVLSGTQAFLVRAVARQSVTLSVSMGFGTPMTAEAEGNDSASGSFQASPEPHAQGDESSEASTPRRRSPERKGRAGGLGRASRRYVCGSRSPCSYHSELSRYPAHEGQVQWH